MTLENIDLAFRELCHIGTLSGDGVFIYHLHEKRLRYVNAALVNIVELDNKLLMDEPELVLQALNEEDREYIQMRWREMLRKRLIEDVQIRLSHRKVVKTVSFSGYLSSDQSYVFGFLKDISKAKEHEDYLITFGARKDALLDAVAQNLSGPLNLSRFTVDRIEKAVTERKFHKLEAHIALMRDVTHGCIRVINDFMREEHLQSPAIHTKANRFDLVAKVRIVLDQMKKTNPDKRLRLKTQITHLFVTGDDLKLFQIVHNLLSNAIKFTGPDGQIEVAIELRGDVVEIVVQDNGIGIPKDLHPFIFEKETRAARPGLNGEVSNGIGLHIVKRLTKLMAGHILFESEERKGTKFILEIPANPPKNHSEGNASGMV